MPPSDFNSHSTDAMFATLIAEIKTVRESQQRTEGALESFAQRVLSLEREKWYQRGVVAAISIGAVAAWDFITRK